MPQFGSVTSDANGSVLYTHTTGSPVSDTATGLRSPWRFSFDSENGDLWCGDVGQYSLEEINLIIRGGNYGWIHRDGTYPGYRNPPPGFSATYIDPLYQYWQVDASGYPNFKGNSIIGGVVYHGTRFSSWRARMSAEIGFRAIFGQCGAVWLETLQWSASLRIPGFAPLGSILPTAMCYSSKTATTPRQFTG